MYTEYNFHACLNFKLGSECLLQGISCSSLAIGLQYELPTCILNTTLPTLQGTSDNLGIWGGVEDVPWIDFYLVC